MVNAIPGRNLLVVTFAYPLPGPWTDQFAHVNGTDNLRFTFARNGKRDFVSRDQVFPLIVVYCLLPLHKNKFFLTQFVHKNCSGTAFICLFSIQSRLQITSGQSPVTLSGHTCFCSDTTCF